MSILEQIFKSLYNQIQLQHKKYSFKGEWYLICKDFHISYYSCLSSNAYKEYT